MILETELIRNKVLYFQSKVVKLISLVSSREIKRCAVRNMALRGALLYDYMKAPLVVLKAEKGKNGSSPRSQDRNNKLESICLRNLKELVSSSQLKNKMEQLKEMKLKKFLEESPYRDILLPNAPLILERTNESEMLSPATNFETETLNILLHGYHGSENDMLKIKGHLSKLKIRNILVLNTLK